MLALQTIPFLEEYGIENIRVTKGAQLVSLYVRLDKMYVVALSDDSVSETEDRRLLVIKGYGRLDLPLPREVDSVRFLGQHIRDSGVVYFVFETLPEEIADPATGEPESGEIEKSKSHKKTK